MLEIRSIVQTLCLFLRFKIIFVSQLYLNYTACQGAIETAFILFLFNEKRTLTTAVIFKSQKQKTMYSRKDKTTYDQVKIP